jgi:flavin reductase (DIM6/NTAB) family NADH-FMN oxidoreductase RutF
MKSKQTGRESNINYRFIDPGSVSVQDLHKFLLSGVAPRPIGFVSTMNSNGDVNLSPFSYFNVFGANPPLLIFSPARRVRDNTIKHTLRNVKAHPEVVVNMVDFRMVEQMSLASTEYDDGVNEFVKSGLTQLPSSQIQVPRVAESPVAFECRVEQVIETGEEGGAGNLVICRVVGIHLKESVLGDDGMIDPLKLDLVARMGGNWYVRTGPENMFEIPKPLTTKGIGVDALPSNARHSEILTGNDLGRLGNAERIPSAKEIEKAAIQLNEIRAKFENNSEKLILIHQEVHKLLQKGETQDALSLVWLGKSL